MLHSRYQAFDYLEKAFEKKKKNGNPILMIVSGYLSLITLGAFLLSMPFAQREPIGVLDAFFTATSAVCVTGLSTIDISASFSPIGNWILVLLMQAGGLGIMTISTVIILLAGMHPGFNHQSALLANYTQEGNVDAQKILKAVLPFTSSWRASAPSSTSPSLPKKPWCSTASTTAFSEASSRPSVPSVT